METTQVTSYVMDVVSEIYVSPTAEFYQNVSDQTNIEFFDEIPWAQLVIMIIVLIFGVVANLSIVFIVMKNKRLRSTPNIIVVNLAIGDLVCLLMNLPFTIHYHWTMEREWLFGEIMCKLTHTSMRASGCITVYSLMALAIERYLAIAWPWRNRNSDRCVRCHRIGRLSSAGQIVLYIWIGSFLVGCPILRSAKLSDSGTCVPLSPHEVGSQIYEASRFVFAYLIPLFTIVAAHILTACALLKSIRDPVTGATAQISSVNGHSSRERTRMKLAVVISVLSVMFFVSWLPHYLFVIWLYFRYDYTIFENPVMYQFFVWKDIPIYILNCMNPVMLYVLSTRFREQLFRDCCCCFGVKRFEWRPAETFSSLKSSFLTANTFRGRSGVTRRSSPSRHDRSLASCNELTKL